MVQETRQRRGRRTVVTLLLQSLLIWGWLGPGSGTAAEEPKPVDFAHEIAPLIKNRCSKCHTNGTYKGKFSLDTREAMLQSEAVVPGKSQESDLVDRLTTDDPLLRMPPKGDPLTANEIAMVRAWIDQGAPGKKGSHSSAALTSRR
jgi:hypothetical protein